jgi:hypothetical protein
LWKMALVALLAASARCWTVWPKAVSSRKSPTNWTSNTTKYDTVKTYVGRIYEKLHVHSRAQAMMKCRQMTASVR